MGALFYFLWFVWDVPFLATYWQSAGLPVMSIAFNVPVLLRFSEQITIVVHARFIISAARQATEAIVVRNIGISVVASLSAITAAAALLIGAPRHYVAILHATPGSNAIPIEWVLDTDQIKHDIATGLDLKNHYGGVPESAAVKKLKQSTKVTRSFGSAVDVEVADRSADMAAKIATAYRQSIYQMTVDKRLTRSATLLYEIRIRKAQAEKYLQQAETKMSEPAIAAAIQSIPSVWVESINSSGSIFAANAINSIGPYQTNGPSTIALETQRLAVLEAVTEQQAERRSAPRVSDVLMDAITALQEASFWKALNSSMSEQEEVLLDRVKAETTGPAVEVPNEETWVYEATPWVASILLMLGGGIAALLISLAVRQRSGGVAQT